MAKLIDYMKMDPAKVAAAIAAKDPAYAGLEEEILRLAPEDLNILANEVLRGVSPEETESPAKKPAAKKPPVKKPAAKKPAKIDWRSTNFSPSALWRKLTKGE